MRKVPSKGWSHDCTTFGLSSTPLLYNINLQFSRNDHHIFSAPLLFTITSSIISSCLKQFNGDMKKKLVPTSDQLGAMFSGIEVPKNDICSLSSTLYAKYVFYKLWKWLDAGEKVWHGTSATHGVRSALVLSRTDHLHTSPYLGKSNLLSWEHFICSLFG